MRSGIGKSGAGSPHFVPDDPGAAFSPATRASTFRQMTNDGSGHRWWEHAVGYEVYIRSFADGNGDGIGDLSGLLDRLDHLAWLGVDIVWITPFYPSPMKDWGYDVSDYVEVDPRFGELADLDNVVSRAHELGLKVLIDIVPNHTSDQHEWFQEARRGIDNPYRDYYIWADPASDGGPPNNWVGYFGGPAWTLDEASGQYYLHLFLPEQPDLNWRNPAVGDEFEQILRFWLDRDVDGFRIDVAQALVKDEQLRSNMQLAEWDPTAERWTQWSCFRHDHDILQPETVDIFRRWNRVCGEHDALLLGETYDLLKLDELDALLRGGDALHIGFWFGAMHTGWHADEIREVFDLPITRIRAGLGWAQNSHDEPRSVSRFGGGDVGRRRALALAVLILGLPGVPFLYQGEELGLENGYVPLEDKLDPVGGDDPRLGRDGARTPMPWEPGSQFGFTTGGETWLPFGGRTAVDTVEVQRTDETSMLNEYRRLLAVRRTIPEIAGEGFEWLELGPDCVAFARGNIVFAANVGMGAPPLPPGDVLYRSDGSGDPAVFDVDEAVIVKRT